MTRPIFMSGMAAVGALIAIDTLTVLEGRVPPRALGLIVEWGSLHREELLADWRRARQLEPMRKIDPLV